MRKSLVILLAFVAIIFIPLSSGAQITHASQGRLDDNATEVLGKAAARFDKNVSFTVTMTVLDGKKVEKARQSAQVRYNKGKYRLTLPDQELISDGTTVWHWNKSAKEVTVSGMVDDDIDLLNPGRLLAGYGKSFKANFDTAKHPDVEVIDMR